MGTALDLSLRAASVLFSLVVLSVSAYLHATQMKGSAPFVLLWATFIGVISACCSLIGILSNWIESLDGKVMILLDGIAGVLNVSGAIWMALLLGGVKCKDWVGQKYSRTAFTIIFSGCETGSAKGNICTLEEVSKADYVGRCKRSEVDVVFMFLTAGVLAATLTLGWIRFKKGF